MRTFVIIGGVRCHFVEELSRGFSPVYLDCTQSVPEGGVVLYAVNVHAHLLGRAISVRHIRFVLVLDCVSLDMQDDHDSVSCFGFG